MPARRTLEAWKPRPAERMLATRMASGEIVIIGDGTLPPENLPDTDPRVIRTSVLRALILGRIKGHPPHEKGVRVQGAYLCGDGKRTAEDAALDLDGCKIKVDVDFERCRITVPIRLNMAKMVSMRFLDSSVHAGVEAKGLIASGGLILRNTRVCQTLDLLGASLAGSLDGDGATFAGYKRRVPDGDTPRIIDGRGLKVGGGLRLPNAKILGVIDFTGAQVRGDLRLNSVQFKSPKMDCFAAILDRVSVSGNFELKGATMTSGLSLQHSKVAGDIRIEGGEYHPPMKENAAVNLHGSSVKQCLRMTGKVSIHGDLDMGAIQVERLEDSRCSWPNSGRLVLDRISIGAFVPGGDDARFRSDWLNRMRRNPFPPQPWEECARVLREMGHGDAARDILIEKEKRQRAARRARVEKALKAARRDRDAAAPEAGVRPHTDQAIGLWWQLQGLRVWDSILGAIVGYGRKPQNAAVWALVFLLLGAVVFGNSGGYGEIKPNDPRILRASEWVDCATGGALAAAYPHQVACFLGQPAAASYPRFNAVIYSADTLVPVVSLEMQDYWIPDETKPRGRWARIYLWLHIAAGWALTLLAVAGFSGLIRTDNTK